MGGKGSGRKKKIDSQDTARQEIVAQPIVEAVPEINKLDDFHKKIDSLKFIRIYDLKLIPKYLFEQVKPQNFDLNEVYAMAPNFERDPFTFLYALADEGHKIKGFLWFRINTVLKTIDGEVLTVDKEYQDKGQIVLKATRLMTTIKEKIGFRAIRIVTKRQRAFGRLGFKTTGEIIMETEG